MHYFLDTEFHQEGCYVELISIGVVDQNGREYYAQNRDCPLEKSNAFVKEHVLPLLDDTSWKSIRTIRRELEEFVGTDPEPLFWCYHGNYDWVAVCGSIFGSMIDTPPNWPHGCFDIVQYGYHLGVLKIPVDETEEGLHNALVDARLNKRSFEWLRQQERQRKSKKKVV